MAQDPALPHGKPKFFTCIPYSSFHPVASFGRRFVLKSAFIPSSFMESTHAECSEESGWTTILCGSLGQDDDGGGGFGSDIEDNDDREDYNNDDDDGGSSLASDACSHVHTNPENLILIEDSNAYTDIGLQDTDDGAAAGGSWYWYNDEGGGYGGGGRNYGLFCEDTHCEKNNKTSGKMEQEYQGKDIYRKI